MSLPDYPTLSKNPDQELWEHGPLYDTTIRTGQTGGMVETRPNSTVVPWYWKFVYRDLPNADMLLLETFEKTTIRYSGAFNWLDKDSVSHEVILGKEIFFRLENTQLNQWRVEVIVVEANPTSD